MKSRTRYWTLHWIRVLLWPLPVRTAFRAWRAAQGRLMQSRRCNSWPTPPSRPALNWASQRPPRGGLSFFAVAKAVAIGAQRTNGRPGP